MVDYFGERESVEKGGVVVDGILAGRILDGTEGRKKAIECAGGNGPY